MTLLQIQNLKTYFPQKTGTVRAVDDVTLSIRKGEVLGLVGESGCGKSTLARTIMRLVPPTSGTITLDGHPLGNSTPRQIQMVFQDPYASLNPRLTIRETLSEPLLVHKLADKKNVPDRVADLMTQVGLSPQFLQKYPHEFSGGQRQRIAIARALALEPRLIIADEPVSALDVSIQAQILNLLADLVRARNLSLLFVSHDLSVVKHISQKIAVMYLGKIVELGDSTTILEQPRHPYTQALISAIPVHATQQKRTRIILPGDPPSPINPPPGCPFHPRCPHSTDICHQQLPTLTPISTTDIPTGTSTQHELSCHHPQPPPNTNAAFSI